MTKKASEKAIVLSSGGIDSTTAISLALARYGQANVETLSIIYGQRHSREIDAAGEIANYFGIKHHVIDITNIGIYQGSECSLILDSGRDIPTTSYSAQRTENEIISTYVPFRNGMMISIAAAFAMSRFPHSSISIYLATHSDDEVISAYADCSQEFIYSMASAILSGTYGRVNIVAPFSYMNKAEIIHEGLILNTPYHLTWSCYNGGNEPCGACGTCIDRAKAFEQNGVADPALRK